MKGEAERNKPPCLFPSLFFTVVAFVRRWVRVGPARRARRHTHTQRCTLAQRLLSLALAHYENTRNHESQADARA